MTDEQPQEEKYNKVISSLQKVVNDYSKSDNKGTNRGWIGALVVGVFVILLTAVFGFIAWRRGKKLAKLLHEKAVSEEKHHQAQVDAQLAESDEAFNDAISQAVEHQENITRLGQEADELKGQLDDVKKDLDDITSWDDVDRYLGR